MLLDPLCISFSILKWGTNSTYTVRKYIDINKITTEMHIQSQIKHCSEGKEPGSMIDTTVGE